MARGKDLRFDIVAYNKTRAAFRQVEQGADRLRRKMAVIGSVTSIGLFSGAVAAGEISRNFLEADANFTKLRTLVGSSQEQVDEWREGLKGLSADLGVPLTELSDGLYDIASSGIETNKVLSTTEAVAKGAALQLFEMGTGGDVVTGAMNAYKNSNLGAAQATAILLAGVRSGKAEAEGFSTSLGLLVPTAARLGVEFHEVVAALSSMSLINSDTAENATQLNGVLLTVLDTSPKVSEALEKVGLSQAILRDELKNKGLLSMLQLLNERFEGNLPAMREAIPNVRAFRAVLNILGGSAERNVEIFADLAKTTADDLVPALKIYEESTSGKLAKATEEWSVQLNELSENSLPRIVDGLVILNATIKATKSLTEQAAAEGWLESAFGVGLDMSASSMPGIAQVRRLNTLLKQTADWIRNREKELREAKAAAKEEGEVIDLYSDMRAMAERLPALRLPPPVEISEVELEQIRKAKDLIDELNAEIVAFGRSDLENEIVKNLATAGVDRGSDLGRQIVERTRAKHAAEQAKTASEEAAQAANSQAEAIERVNGDLIFQRDQLARSAVEQEIYNNLKQAGVERDSEWGRLIEMNTRELYAAAEAQRQMNDTLQFGGYLAVDVFDRITDGTDNWRDALLDVVSVLKRAVLEAAILGQGPLANLFGTAATGNAPGGLLGLLFSAKGNAFDRGNVVPFARGGVVDRPTLFPMANGAGLMGEAGPEAILPLRRGAGGRLGVEATRGGGDTFNMPITIQGSADKQTLAAMRREIPGIVMKTVRESKSRRLG